MPLGYATAPLQCLHQITYFDLFNRFVGAVSHQHRRTTSHAFEVVVTSLQFFAIILMLASQHLQSTTAQRKRTTVTTTRPVAVGGAERNLLDTLDGGDQLNRLATQKQRFFVGGDGQTKN